MSENRNTETGFRIDLMNCADTRIDIKYNATVGGGWVCELKLGNIEGGHYYRTGIYGADYSEMIQKAADKAKSFRIENQSKDQTP